LSYSKLAYSGLSGKRTGKGATVGARVKNQSMRETDEVVQLYVAGSGAAGDPVRSLRGFQRVHLKPGESREVEFAIRSEDLPKQKVRVSIGSGQPTGQIPYVEGVL